MVEATTWGGVADVVETSGGAGWGGMVVLRTLDESGYGGFRLGSGR